MAVTPETVRREALALPDVTEAPSYGTPGFRVGGKLFARLHQDGESLVLRTDQDERELLLKQQPRLFFLTDHYVGYSWVLLRLDEASPAALREALEHAWEHVKPKARKASPTKKRR